MNVNEIMKELAEYIRMQEETAAIIDGLKDQLKEHMQAAGVDTLSSPEHRAIYRPVASNRIDTAALKKELPEIAARYTKTTESLRFTFN